jgi:hypothetical protein
LADVAIIGKTGHTLENAGLKTSEAPVVEQTAWLNRI